MTSNNLRKSGLEIVGEMPWGTNFCQFYKTKEDLLDLLIPYFKAGLENNEYCMWVTSEPLKKEEAIKAIREAFPAFTEFEKNGQIEIISYEEWYVKDGGFEPERVLASWKKKLEAAQKKGFSGLRLSGDTYWLESDDWDIFSDYEEKINRVIGNYNMLAAHTYSLEKCSANAILDVIKNHKFALIKLEGSWTRIESAEEKKTREEIEMTASFPMLNPYPVVEADTNGNIFYANPSAENLFPDLFLLGKAHKWLNSWNSVAQFFKEGNNKTTVREIAVNGKVYQQAMYYVKELDRIRIYGVDVTERSLSEQALKESEKKYRRLYESMNEGAIILEIIYDFQGIADDYIFLDLNSAYEKITGAKKSDRLGKKAKDIYGHARNLDIYSEVAETGRPVTFETYNPSFKKHFRISAFSYEKGKVALILNDITERKLEEEAKNNFIAIMSHELRNPLTPILSGVQLIRKCINNNALKLLDPVIEDSFAIIEKQSTNLARLLDDLLDISRITQGKIALKIEKIDVNACLGHAVKAIKPIIDSQKHSLTVSLEDKPIFIEADPVRFEQIIINLLNNSAKYTQSGGKIELSASRQDEEVEIIIRDNGVGIEPEKIDSMFQLFARSGEPFTSTQGELGIGLKLVKDLVAMQGGVIIPRSQGVNQGAEFVIRFKALPDSEKKITGEKKTAIKIKAGPLPKRLKVLTIDDNETITRLFSHVLNLFGHEAIICNNSYNTMEMIVEHEPHIAMVDIGMPGKNGYEVAQEIRNWEKENGKNIKLIAVTGFGQDQDLKKTREAGFDLHLVKPVEIDTLEKALNDLSR